VNALTLAYYNLIWAMEQGANMDDLLTEFIYYYHTGKIEDLMQ